MSHEAVALFATERARDGGELLERSAWPRGAARAFARLSGGERQRLFLVLALLNRPRLVILDELTQGLDPAARRRRLVGRCTSCASDGTTVLLVTHELDEAEALCDRVVAMRAGRILDPGTPADLIDRHGRWATIRFSRDGARDSCRLAGCPACVRCRRARPGHRPRRPPLIAHVGAALVARAVPPDLRVECPISRTRCSLLEASRCREIGDRPSSAPDRPERVVD